MSQQRPDDSGHSMRRLLPKLVVGGLLVLAVLAALHIADSGIPLH